MKDVDHYTKYNPNVDYNIPFIKEEIIEKKGLFLHTKEMHKWVNQCTYTNNQGN